MKKLLLTSFAVAAFMLQSKAQTFTHAPVVVTGFTADVIADGPGSASVSTNADVDGQNYNFVAQNFVNPTNSSPTSYLPTGGLINSLATPGLPFQLEPYTGNNSLRLTTTANSGTLTFATPRTADKLTLLVTTAIATGTTAFTATVNFSDATTQDFTSNVVPNWFDGASPAIQGISRVLRTTNSIENSTTNPRMYQYPLVLSAANALKPIASITITKTTTAATEVLHVFAVTASMAIPNDIGVSSFTSPTSTVVPNVSQPVTVTVKNFGANSNSSASLGFKVNGTVVLNNVPFTPAPALNTNDVSAPVTIGNFAFPFGAHKIKAWTKLPNGVADGGPLNDTLELNIFSCNPLTGSFNINKNVPASATNFQSFSAAAQALTSCGVSGPVTFNVVAGSGPYNEQVTLPVIAGTSLTNTITFEGNGNTLTAATTTAKPGVITFNGADFVKINNLRIDVDITMPACWGVQLINASDNNSITNCTINIPLTTNSQSYQGIFAGINVTSVGNYANNLLVQDNIINGGYYAITLVGTTTGTVTTGNRFIGNQIRDPFSNGFYINFGGTGTIIERNDISRPTRTNGSTFYGILLAGGTTNTIISKNRIHNTHDKAAATNNFVYGIYSLSAATVGNENIIKNNLIYNINNKAGSFQAFYNSGGNGTWYFHNTVSADDPAISFNQVRAFYVVQASTNLKFINNILSISSPATTKHAMYLQNAALALVSNNNLLYVGATGNIGYYSADKATLTDWKTVNANAYDQASISTDPIFVNTSSGYLQPLAPAVDNIGQPIAGITDDILGNPRSATTPDIGAFEFTPAVNDVGLTAINSPTSPVNPGSQPVLVTLRNFGTAALTTATIGWKVNNVTQPNFAWTGPLATLTSTTTPVNIGNFNFVGGSYTIKAWAKLPNGVTDPLAANDTIVLTVFSCAPLAGNYTVNKNNPTAGTNFQSLTEVAQKLNSCGVSGPVTFTVAAGTGPYNEQVEIMSIPFVSATNNVTFEGSGNTVSATPVLAGKQGIMILNGAKYVTLNNFMITLPASAIIGSGIQLINAADYATISNNTINLSLTSTATDVNGILAGSAHLGTGNHTNNSRIVNNTISGGYNGIQLNGLSGGTVASNNQILGNTVKDFYVNGIYLNNATATLVEGNDISRPTRTNGFNLQIITLTGTSMSNIINKNRIHNCSDGQPTNAGYNYGIYTGAGATPGNENIIKNNLIYNMNNAGGNYFGLYNSGANGTWYYNNTVMADPAIVHTVIRGIYFTAASTNVKFINNIISLPNNASSNVKHGIYLGSASIQLISNNNSIFVGTNANSYIGFYSTNRATLADWKTANTNAYDQNSVDIDPVFAGAATGNLKPTALTLDNLGQPVPAVIDDILGANRNITTPDMGAYEFGTTTDDAGITAITDPNSGCGLSNAETITVTIKNNGPAALAFVPVSYTINGGTAVNEIFTGTLAPNATVNYSFTTKANLAATGSFAIVAAANLVNDALATNNSFTKTVVGGAPSAVPTITAGGPTAICSGSSVTLTAATSTTGATYAWFKDGTAITGATAATYAANAAGSYTVVASANGCPSPVSAATTVTVNALPTPAITGLNASYCKSAAAVTLTGTPAGSTFTIDGVAATSFNPATLTIGAHTVVVSNTNASSCTGTATQTVNVTAAPVVPTITAGGPTAICSGSSVTLTAATSTTGATYAWFKDGTAITGATAATYAANAAGSYTVVASAGGCSATSTATAITVNAAPAVPTITAGGSTTFCTGGSVTLTGASTTTGATYAWYRNGTAISGATSATYTANVAGSYTVIATANGCSTAYSAVTTVTINAIPATPTITNSGSTTFCAGGSVTFTAASTTTGATYAWFLNGTAITGATSATYMANAAGNYTVVATAGGCASTASTATAVTVTPLPTTPTISRSGFVLTSSSTTGNQWYFNGTLITGATGATYTSTANGAYTVVVTTNGCSSAVSAAVTIVNTGIKDVQNIAVEVYPNPSEGLVNVTLPKNQAYKIQVTDLTGKVILTEKVTNSKTQLNLGKVAKGIYLLKISGEKEAAVRKLIIE